MNSSLARRAAVAAALLTAVLMPGHALAQSNDSPASMFVEVGGNGLVYSLNYEGNIGDRYTGRVGFTFLNVTVVGEDSGEESQVAVTIVPVLGNVLLGSGRTRVELGAGPLLAVKSTGVNRIERGNASIEMDSDWSVAGVTSTVGVRFQPRNGMLLRATLTPFYSKRAQIWGGLSFGWAL